MGKCGSSDHASSRSTHRYANHATPHSGLHFPTLAARAASLPIRGGEEFDLPLHKPNFHVFTGGGGTGKTTLIRHLAALGERVVDENIRAVIREQVDCGGSAVPWLDAKACADLTTVRDIADFDRLAGETRRVFFDRGLMDMYGSNGVAPSPTLEDAIRTRRYNARIFVFPPWQEIYGVDAERREDWSRMEAVFDATMSTLPALGYQPVVVPKVSVEERAAFVLAFAG